MERMAVEWDTLLWGYRDDWQGVIPPQPQGTLVQYIIEAWHGARDEVLYAGERDTPQVYGFYVDDEEVPTWLREAVIYHIFVDRFAPDPGRDFTIPPEAPNGYYGGTLRGLTSRLDYLTDLGVTCLWLSPIFPSPTYHGYDCTDYGTIATHLGREEDFTTLVTEAHQRGMHIILDFVANHLSNQHPAFVTAQADHNNPTVDWFFFRKWPDDYEDFFNVREMPIINTDNPHARAHLVEHARRWIERGCDGFRLDHADGPSHAFWSAMRAATRVANPESVMLGEVIETPLLQRSFSGRMDGCLDFLLHQAMRRFFAFDLITVTQFDSFLQRHFDFFPANYVQPSFLDNHDVNRFLWTVRGDTRRLKLTALCQFTLPGSPIIYYGTEVGLNQENDVGQLEEARQPMPWQENAQDRDLHTYYKALIAFRRRTCRHWCRPRRTLITDDAQGIYAYSCGPYTVVLNNSSQSTTIFSLPDRLAELAFTTDAQSSWQNGQLTLPPFAGACLQQ
jgi:glycosidase